MKKIKNLPKYAWEYGYVVAREVNGEFWFYGAFPGIRTAQAAAKEIGNGAIFKMLRGKE